MFRLATTHTITTVQAFIAGAATHGYVTTNITGRRIAWSTI